MLSDTFRAEDSSMNVSTIGASIVDGDLTTTTSNGNGTARSQAKPLSGPPTGSGNFPPPKTDKPRPHICGTCGRSFARLEHLKRHERSHTKEKPFECPECTRCFARRDLLLRHQQKLHLTAAPSSRPRTGRRESTSSTAASTSARARKNSLANSGVVNQRGSGAGFARPRANTISHVDHATLGMLAAANVSSMASNGIEASPNATSGGLPGPGGYEFRGMSTSTGRHGNPHVLPRLTTNGPYTDVSSNLRTAPAFGRLGNCAVADNIIFGPDSTINPAQLHSMDSPCSMPFHDLTSPYSQTFSEMFTDPLRMEDIDANDWMNGFDNQMSFNDANDHAIGGSSPSAMSTNSHSGMSETMLDGSNNPVYATALWQNSMMSQVPTNSIYPVDFSSSSYPDLLPTGLISPISTHDQMAGTEQYLSAPPPLAAPSPIPTMHGPHKNYYHTPAMVHSETPSNSSASISDASNRQSSVTSTSTEHVTDALRQSLLTTLSHPSMSGHRYRPPSHQNVGSSPSPVDMEGAHNSINATLPSTYDLTRYVSAYIQFFHPHLPFLHVSTLSFDSFIYKDDLPSPNGHVQPSQGRVVGGGGCLLLAVAAIGALHEYEIDVSKDLFGMAKKMIKLYLEEHRKADMSSSFRVSDGNGESPTHSTPLWLVQAMLLNLIYGHNCGDKTSANIAHTHCAALVSLARAAELTQPSRLGLITQPDSMTSTRNNWSDQQETWCNWIAAEEKKRTLFAVYVFSSLLVSAYNHSPALTNSEIRLDLPCEESFWAAESAEAWHALGGAAATENNAMPFALALSSLLTASQRRQHHQLPQELHQSIRSEQEAEDISEGFKPSGFGCLVLINALHNYIWETRQRHFSREWTLQETEAMHAQIEPALQSWQAAWASSSQNILAASPIAADCVPLLDLAYVRLYVNLESSKEAVWHVGYERMDLNSEEDSKLGNEAQEESLEQGSISNGSIIDSSIQPYYPIKPEQSPSTSDILEQPKQVSDRERHLRKAAFYAVDSLSIFDKFCMPFVDFKYRGLPLQSAICAFNCAQVLAEWVSTVQERVGHYVGILGKGEMQYKSILDIMLLDDEDCELLQKIAGVLGNAEAKIMMKIGAMDATIHSSTFTDGGFGCKVLLVTAHMLDEAAVWPVTRLMAHSLEIRAARVQAKAEASASQHSDASMLSQN